MLLLSNGRTVKVLSTTNKSADSSVAKLNAELARLKGQGITVTDKHIVRFHPPTVEERVVQHEVTRHVETNDSLRRWQPGYGLLQAQFDQVAAALMDEAHQSHFGTEDRRYKYNNASFGTLLLRTAGVLDRPNPHPGPILAAQPQTETDTEHLNAGADLNLSNSQAAEPQAATNTEHPNACDNPIQDNPFENDPNPISTHGGSIALRKASEATTNINKPQS